MYWLTCTGGWSQERNIKPWIAIVIQTLFNLIFSNETQRHEWTSVADGLRIMTRNNHCHRVLWSAVGRKTFAHRWFVCCGPNHQTSVIWFLWAEKGKFVTRHAASFKVDRQNLHHLIGAISGFIYEAKITTGKWHFRATSCELFVASCHTDETWRPWLAPKDMEALWSTYYATLTFMMHSTAGCGTWFAPTTRNARCTWVGSCSYHKRTGPDFVRKRTKTKSSRTFRSGCFDLVWLLYWHQPKRTVLMRKLHQSFVRTC